MDNSVLLVLGDVRELVNGVSQRMLTMTLRGLERDGMVKRTVYPTTPPRVEYELTPLGHSLSKPVEALGRWAFAHLDEIQAARVAFDERTLRESAETSVSSGI
jgi:DNA-binding HxlR family transcriptional regulator